MNIVYASDDNFAEMLGISMLSLFENNKKCDEIVVYILDDGIKEESKKRILSISEKYSRKIIFCPIPDLHKLAGVEIKTNNRWHLSTFSRLYAEKILPDSIDKILYLDCDILINDSLEKMFAEDLGDNYCAAVWDCISDLHKGNIGLKAESGYFNAGVMLISLDKWRKNHLCDMFMDFIKRYNGDTPYVDQGVINGTISENIKKLDLRYNSYTVLHDFNYKDLLIYRKPSSFYSEEEVKEAVENPAIIHFTTSFLSLRPWVESCKHPYASEWLKYKAMSPWADVPLRKDNRSFKKKAAVGIYNILPHGMAVRIAGWLHAVVSAKVKGQ